MSAAEPWRAAFRAALLDPQAPAPAGLAAPPGDTLARRFAVYRSSTASGLVEALRARFPIAGRIVGEAFFAAAAGLFARANPPREKILHRYGEDFPDFLARFPPAAGLPYLADVARLEAALTRAHHARDAAPLPPAALAAVDPERLAGARLVLHPAARALASPFAIVSILEAHREDPPARVDAGRAEEALVARPGFAVSVRRLPPGGSALVAALAAGAPLGEAASGVLDDRPDLDLPAILAALLRAGALADLVLDGASP